MAVPLVLQALLWVFPAQANAFSDRAQARSYNGAVGARLRANEITHRPQAASYTDYVLPSETSGGVILPTRSAVQSISPKASKTQATVSYWTFAGLSFELVEHRGLRVAVLLPATEPEGLHFTADHIEELVEQLDLLYSLYGAVTGAEPGGNGLLNIAFVPETCAQGCALLGSRGIEVLADEANYAAIIQELDAGQLAPLLLHEMAHNFDVLAGYLHYLPDHAHAWTDMFQYFAPYRYARMPGRDEGPEELFDSPVGALWQQYVGDSTATWAHCVAAAACPELPANGLWAMMYYRILAVYGSDALLKSFAFLADYARTHAPPATAGAKEDLRILSLGVGAGANIACAMDTLRWPTGSAVRSELQKRFGTQNPYCADSDGDGFNTINGDCDDSRSSSHILATEIPGNGRDDDCDERVDEMSLAESSSGKDFSGTVAAKMPAEIRGSSADLDDFDTFTFPLPPSARARVTLCARDGFTGWAMALQPDGSALTKPNWYLYRPLPGCSNATFDYTGMAQGVLAIAPNDSLGAYELTVSPGLPLPRDASGAFQIAARAAGGMTVEIGDEDGILANLGADAVELSVAAAGMSIVRPYTPGLKVELNAQSAPQLQDGREYQLRVRPLSDGHPLAAFSAGQRFRYDRVTRVLPAVDDLMSGAWRDPEHRGEGFMFEGLGNGRALVYWFTYDDQGRQRWMLGTGTVDGNRVDVETLLQPQGARFGKAFSPADVELVEVGSLSVTFLDCSSAYVNYSVDNVGGNLSVERLSHVFGHRCDQTVPPPAVDVSGSWSDPAHRGEGFVVQQLDATQALVFWFTYDDEGRQAWLFNTGTIENGRITVPAVLRTSGGHFGRSFRPEEVLLENWGELVLDLSCSTGSMRWTSALMKDGSGSLKPLPLTRLQNSGCL